MYQRILVAIDGSETAQLALNHAVQLAKDQRARLRIAHVVEVLGLTYTASMAGGYPFDATTVLESLRESASKLLQEAEAKARSADIEVETVLLEDDDPTARVASAISKEADRWEADLIVLGTHGRRGFDRLLLGSVAETLVRTATLPLLLVRGQPRST
jgi:nucleotide-binding universal stress UspA family protein